jgi:hypothetical protein
MKYNQAGCSKGDALDFYLGGVRFESWPGHLLYKQMIFLVLFSPSKQILEQYLHYAMTVPNKFIVHQAS